MTRKWKQPPGLHANRLHPDADNPREVAFAEQWVQENQPRTQSMANYGTALSALLGGDYQPRDEVIVATMFQWLGSNVGFSFLRDALNRAGYVVEEKNA